MTTIPGLTDTLTSVDRAADLFEVSDTSDSGNSKKTSVNSMLDLTSHPVGIGDVQTLTNKTITAPAVSSPTLSGTVTGTYTLGGTPTFPSTVATLTGSQTLTNKVLTSPTITSPTITNPTITVDTISEFTSANGVVIDGVLLKDSKMNGSYITDTTVGNSQLALGVSVQTVYASSGAVATGTAIIPLDDTIPQITEGTEFITCSITPKSLTNVLVVEAFIYASLSITSADLIGALFQDSTANALTANEGYVAAVASPFPLTLAYIGVANTVSSTTFRVRLGGNSASTVTFNGASGARRFGAIPKSWIKITEYKAA